jgi:phosphoribosyl 1,2-cyclic phosphodiesterase
VVATLRFLGTGASGGTPGRGRSRRLESSLLIDHETPILIDVTRQFDEQSKVVSRLNAILLTHAHADAAGGIPALHRWWRARHDDPIPVYANVETIGVLERRFRRLEHCRFVAVSEGRGYRVGAWVVTGCTVPHAREARYRTFAWRLVLDDTELVYASDVSKLTPALERLSRGASLLVIDGAMWGRQIFTHLRIDRALPELCRWNVKRIVLTQIGKTLPPQTQLEREVADLCGRASPAYDGLELAL